MLSRNGTLLMKYRSGQVAISAFPKIVNPAVHG